MGEARYDTVAEFYADNFPDRYDEPVMTMLFERLGDLAGCRVADLCCGHGRVTREIARRGAHVVGVDLSTAMLTIATDRDAVDGLGVVYRHGDASKPGALGGDTFDAVVCHFGLSDLQDLAGLAKNARAGLRSGGRFVFAIVHPCFVGGPSSSGSWSTHRSYVDEGFWIADGAQSSLRRRVGAVHRTVSTYINTFLAQGLTLERLDEPGYRPGEHVDHRGPVYLMGTFIRS